MNNKLFEHLQDARKDILAGRVLGTQLGTVVAVDDPLHLNRVQVTTADKGGLSTSPWCYMLTSGKGLTTSQPIVGDTVLISYLDADAHKPICLGILHNIINVPVPNGHHIHLRDTETFSISLSGITLVISNGSATINGKDIATVDATTNNGRVITRGY